MPLCMLPLNLERCLDGVAVQPEHVDQLDGPVSDRIELLRQDCPAAWHIAEALTLPFPALVIAGDVHVKAHIRAELEEQVPDLSVGRGGRPSLFWRLPLVVLWYDYRAIGRLVPFGAPGTTGREPAEGPYDRVNLCFPQCTHDRFAVRRLPPDRRSPEWSLPPVRVSQSLKDGELVAHIQDRNPLLWRER